MNKQFERMIPANTVSNPSPFFLERLREDSNLEMEWLWAAGEVNNPDEQRYCLLRVLYINPDNLDVQRALHLLDRQQKAEAAPATQRSGFRLWPQRSTKPGIA